MSQSLAEKIALLSPAERMEALEGIDFDGLEHDWSFWGRPEQFAPDGHWTTWLIVAGRGFGKTRAGAEWIHKKAMENPGCRIALVGRSASDVSSVMIGGESGILAIAAPADRPTYKPSLRKLIWPNGSIAETFSAEAPDQLRGPQFHFSWADEAAAWKFVKDASGLNAWDNLSFATRSGSMPQVIATTTPKRTEFMISLLAQYEEQEKEKLEGTFDHEGGEIVITRGSTYDNVTNLAKSYIKDITGKYQGTNIAQQELLGLMLDDTTGALWSLDMLEHDMMLPYGEDTLSLRAKLPYRVVALDPSVAENPKDECGIVVVGATKGRELHKRHAFVLEDASLLGSPDVWARKAVQMAKKWNCPIIAEGTQGQALVKNMIRSIDPSVKVLLVQTGNQSKKVRAEPVLLPYQQHRVHHKVGLDTLEIQLTTWDPETSKKSPDRLDALVHGVTALLIKPPKGLASGPLTAKSSGRRQLPTGRGTGRTRAGGELGKPR